MQLFRIIVSIRNTMKFEPKDPVPILVIRRSYNILLFIAMIGLAIGFICVMTQIWKQDRIFQLMILLGSFPLYLGLFLLFYKLLQYIASKNPVIKCYDTYMVINKKETISYIHIFEIVREVRKKGNKYEEFLILNYEMGGHSYDVDFLEGGYYELKSVLEKNTYALNIEFKNREIDDRWFRF
jgi:hypothetical protein